MSRAAIPHQARGTSERPIRVCVLLGRYLPDFAGHGFQFQRLLPYLFRCGVEAAIVTRKPVSGIAWSVQDAGPVHRVLPAPDEPLARPRGVAIVRSFLRRHGSDYDVVHGALPDWEFYLNLPYMKRRGLRVLQEMCLLGSDDPIAIRRERLGNLKLRLLRSVDAWVGISETFLPRLAEADIASDLFHCIYTGVDTDRYKPARDERRLELRSALGIPADGRVVVSVGALLARKGMDRLLHAWARLAPKPERDVLLLVGPASEREGLRPQHLAHVKELERLASSPELAGTVRAVGRVDNVEDYLCAADVFALLSRREGLGTVTLEAMACGLPCLVAPLDGIGREIVSDGRTGFVVDDPDDAEVVAAKLGWLLSQPEARRRLGDEAVVDARARFSMEVRARKLAELYRELAEPSRDRAVRPQPGRAGSD